MKKRFVAISVVALMFAGVFCSGAAMSVRGEESPVPEEPAQASGQPTEEAATDEVSAEDDVRNEVSYITGDGHDIPIIVTLPEGASEESPVPAVVMLHGTASNKDEAGGGYASLAPMLADAGIASIRFDYVGNGDSKGDYVDYNFTSALGDAMAVTDYIKSIPEIDTERIGIMGWSQGGTHAILAAAEYPDVFKSVVTWAGALDLSMIATEEMREEAKEQGYTMYDPGFTDPLKLSEQWIEDVDNTDVLAAVPEIKGAVLAIAGSADDTVPPENSQQIADAATNEKSGVYFIDGADHTFNIFTDDRSAYEDLAKTTVDWFKETL